MLFGGILVRNSEYLLGVLVYAAFFLSIVIYFLNKTKW